MQGQASDEGRDANLYDDRHARHQGRLPGVRHQPVPHGRHARARRAGKTGAAAAQAEAAQLEERQGRRPAETFRQTGDRRVALEGQDHRQVPGPRLPGQSLDRARARPAEVAAERGRGPRLRAEIPGAEQQERGRQRADRRGGQGRGSVPGDRPRPRGRSHRLASDGSRTDSRVDCAARGVRRDHARRHQGSLRAPARHRHAARECPAGAAHPRPPGRLPDQPACSGKKCAAACRPGACNPPRSGS